MPLPFSITIREVLTVEGKKRHQISHLDLLKLYQAVGDKRDYIEKQRPAKPQLLGELSQALGFPVTAGALKTAVDGHGIAYKPTPARRRGAGKFAKMVRERLDAIEHRLAHLEESLGVIHTPDTPNDGE